MLCATSVPTIDFLLRRERDRAVSRQGIGWLLSLFDIAPVDRAVIDHALRLEWADFEDAVLHESARLARATSLVTRNISDFKMSQLPVYTPEEFLAILGAGAT